MSLNVSHHVSLIEENVCGFALLSFLKLCQRFATTSEDFLRNCISFEQVSRWGASTRLSVLHKFACIYNNDNNTVVIL